MATINANINTLKNSVKTLTNDLQTNIRNAHNYSGGLLIPSDFKYCNYLIYDFWDVTTKHVNTAAEIYNWINNCINILERLDGSFSSSVRSLPITTIKKNNNQLHV